MNKVNNLRGQKTRVTIRETLLFLLDRHPVDAISTTMICQQAGINRSTFYCHYKSIADIFTDTADEIDQELFGLALENPLFSVEQRFSLLAEIVMKYTAFFTAWFSLPECEPHLRFLSDEIVKPLTVTSPHQEYHAEYYEKGIWAILRLWLREGMAETEQDIVTIFNKHML